MGSLATELTGVRQADTKDDAADASLGKLAHELRQPLSNIEAIAYYLSMILPPGDEKVQTHLVRIRELVEQSNSILSAALASALNPAAAPQPSAPPA
jgi:nitrogen-specific signal transduction histidine kinase